MNLNSNKLVTKEIKLHFIYLTIKFVIIKNNKINFNKKNIQLIFGTGKKLVKSILHLNGLCKATKRAIIVTITRRIWG